MLFNQFCYEGLSLTLTLTWTGIFKPNIDSPKHARLFKIR